MNMETIETIAAIILLLIIFISAVIGMVMIGLSYDVDAWLNRQAGYWREECAKKGGAE